MKLTLGTVLLCISLFAACDDDHSIYGGCKGDEWVDAGPDCSLIRVPYGC